MSPINDHYHLIQRHPSGERETAPHSSTAPRCLCLLGGADPRPQMLNLRQFIDYWPNSLSAEPQMDCGDLPQLSKLGLYCNHHQREGKQP
jgi:hypothetical protein